MRDVRTTLSRRAFLGTTAALAASSSGGLRRALAAEAGKPDFCFNGVQIGTITYSTQIKPDTYDGDLLSHSDYLGIHLDIGHYIAGTSQSPMPMIEKHHKRILSLHLKDRKKNKLAFPADIELEYNVPKESDAVKEVAKCVQFCKEALA